MQTHFQSTLRNKLGVGWVCREGSQKEARLAPSVGPSQIWYWFFVLHLLCQWLVGGEGGWFYSFFANPVLPIGHNQPSPPTNQSDQSEFAMHDDMLSKIVPTNTSFRKGIFAFNVWNAWDWTGRRGPFCTHSGAWSLFDLMLTHSRLVLDIIVQGSSEWER